MQGSATRNVILTEAGVVTNMRLNPADSVETAMAHLYRFPPSDGTVLILT